MPGRPAPSRSSCRPAAGRRGAARPQLRLKSLSDYMQGHVRRYLNWPLSSYNTSDADFKGAATSPSSLPPTMLKALLLLCASNHQHHELLY
eukprot:2729213-Pyramimonas_sp.AAC.1